MESAYTALYLRGQSAGMLGAAVDWQWSGCGVFSCYHHHFRSLKLTLMCLTSHRNTVRLSALSNSLHKPYPGNGIHDVGKFQSGDSQVKAPASLNIIPDLSGLIPDGYPQCLFSKSAPSYSSRESLNLSVRADGMPASFDTLRAS